MIENNRRQAPTIKQAYTVAVSYCAQLIISAGEHAGIIPYSDQHAVALLMLLSSWMQHTFLLFFAKVFQ